MRDIIGIFRLKMMTKKKEKYNWNFRLKIYDKNK